MTIDRACRVCEKPPVDALELPSVPVCRRCAAAIGRLLETKGDALLTSLWRHAPRPIADTTRARATILATPNAARAHFDLGCAYVTRGMAVEAIRELAVALQPGAPSAVASDAFARIFLSPEARPEALADLIVAFRGELQSM